MFKGHLSTLEHERAASKLLTDIETIKKSQDVLFSCGVEPKTGNRAMWDFLKISRFYHLPEENKEDLMTTCQSRVMEETISSATMHSINICLFLWFKDLRYWKMNECVFNMFYFSSLGIFSYKDVSGRKRFNDDISALTSVITIINGFMIWNRCSSMFYWAAGGTFFSLMSLYMMC